MKVGYFDDYSHSALGNQLDFYKRSIEREGHRTKRFINFPESLPEEIGAFILNIDNERLREDKDKLRRLVDENLDTTFFIIDPLSFIVEDLGPRDNVCYIDLLGNGVIAFNECLQKASK
ncbi:MAG: hypothetical protein ABIB79_01540 [archaeon]